MHLFFHGSQFSISSGRSFHRFFYRHHNFTNLPAYISTISTYFFFSSSSLKSTLTSKSSPSSYKSLENPPSITSSYSPSSIISSRSFASCFILSSNPEARANSYILSRSARKAASRSLDDRSDNFLRSPFLPVRPARNSSESSMDSYDDSLPSPRSENSSSRKRRVGELPHPNTAVVDRRFEVSVGTKALMLELRENKRRSFVWIMVGVFCRIEERGW
mmetsp:Transcript_8878/g.12274  ORF Transcript_8878/g.12274 Transcript_8878/m.12274 type:complete len:218 (+) Transcript_8878:76-729(+)